MILEWAKVVGKCPVVCKGARALSLLQDRPVTILAAELLIILPLKAHVQLLHMLPLPLRLLELLLQGFFTTIVHFDVLFLLLGLFLL